MRLYSKQQAVLEEMQSRLERVRKENIELSRKIRLLKNDPAYMEQVVRTRLHYVQDNEIMYLPRKMQVSADVGE